MMARICRAYCRSTAQMACSPLAAGASVAILLLLVIGGGRAHAHGIAHALDCAAAFTLAMTAGGLLGWAARIVTRASGHHADPATLPATAAAAEPVPVPLRRVRAPAEMPPGGPSWPLHPARVSYAIRPPAAEAARDEHAAAADGGGRELARREP